MSVFRPNDGVIFFVWRNALLRTTEVTYDMLYTPQVYRDEAGDLNTPFQPMFNPEIQEMEYIRLLPERTFMEPNAVDIYVKRMIRRMTTRTGRNIPPLTVRVSSPNEPDAHRLRLDGGVLVLPAPSREDAFTAAPFDASQRAAFIRQRWLDGQSHWPILEHHVWHEIAHHITGGHTHDDFFATVLCDIIDEASRNTTFLPTLWARYESMVRSALTSGEAYVDEPTGAYYRLDANNVIHQTGIEERIAA